MTLIITGTSKTQLEKLADGLCKTTDTAGKCGGEIDNILRKKLDDAVYAGNEDASEWGDKFGNNVSSLGGIALCLQCELDAQKADHLQMEDYLNRIKTWMESESDKPKTPGETNSQAMDRVLQNLDDFIVKHRSVFDGAEQQSLQKNLAGLRDVMKEISKHVGEAKRLCAIVIQSGAAHGGP